MIFEWIVNVKRSDELDQEGLVIGAEISVLKRTNTHGQKSYGWENNEDKILVFGNGGPCRYKLRPNIFNKLVEVAEEICDELNIKEDKKK